MPYVDKILAKEYRTRTQVPYMKKWREENREHHRKYMREYNRKRRADKKKRESDNKKKKQCQSYKAALASKRTTYLSREAVASLADRYVVSTLTKHTDGMLTAKDVRLYPEIIQIQKQIIITKRLLKNDNTSNLFV